MGDFNLSDFLGTAGSVYTAYQGAQSTSDTAKIAQATAATAAAQAQSRQATTDALIKWGLIGGGVLVAIIVITLVFKKLR